MKPENPIWALISTFGLMSLFAVGGAAAAVAEMHRIAVEVHHWMTDKQFTDAYAIAQLSPGPNVLIVTLIGYAVAGIPGALAATAGDVPADGAACLLCQPPPQPSKSRWPGLIQAALVPLSIGLMAASALILAQSTDRTIAAVLLTAMVAVIAAVPRINPLWLLLAGGLLGFAGIV
ncbi:MULTISPECIES: chromate transporter [unclassified Bradyrhizobium]|uniref:chromate transporter n=1 Tax=unclassified Bradyrhizobium TaxID=2631580 RepID=UPI0015CAEB49|nr:MULTISPECIES: chromate transporter [unclassified Bradyrhizobium]MBB4261067.1 chromate transporter [Bradyrhizobium sp. CIR3A]NYG47341.1 chromate transporter [Bradyrhizobium sp. IAR9]